MTTENKNSSRIGPRNNNKNRHHHSRKDLVSIILDQLPKQFHPRNGDTDDNHDMMARKANELIRILETRVRVGQLGKYDSLESRAVVILERILSMYHNQDGHPSRGSSSSLLLLEELGKTVAIRATTKEFQTFRTNLKRYLSSTPSYVTNAASGHSTTHNHHQGGGRYSRQASRLLSLAPKTFVENSIRNQKSRDASSSSLKQNSSSPMDSSMMEKDNNHQNSLWTMDDLAIRLSEWILDPGECAEKAQQLCDIYYEYISPKQKQNKNHHVDDFDRNQAYYQAACLFLVVKQSEGHSLKIILSSIVNNKSTATSTKRRSIPNPNNHNNHGDAMPLEQDDDDEHINPILEIEHMISLPSSLLDDEDLFRNILKYIITTIQKMIQSRKYEKIKWLSINRKLNNNQKQKKNHKRKRDEASNHAKSKLTNHLSKSMKLNVHDEIKDNHKINDQNVESATHKDKQYDSSPTQKQLQPTSQSTTIRRNQFLEWKQKTLENVLSKYSNELLTRPKREIFHIAAVEILNRVGVSSSSDKKDSTKSLDP